MNAVILLAQARRTDERAVFLWFYGAEGSYRYERYRQDCKLPKELEQFATRQLERGNG